MKKQFQFMSNLLRAVYRKIILSKKKILASHYKSRYQNEIIYEKIFFIKEAKERFPQACKTRNRSSSLIRVRGERKSGNICHR